jgi:hypothetical protein
MEKSRLQVFGTRLQELISDELTRSGTRERVRSR